MKVEKSVPLEIDEVWQQGQLVEIAIADLTDEGEGVGRFQGRVVFVPDTVPGDRALVRLIRVKPQYARAKLHQLLKASNQRLRPHCIVADKCGGCQWQHVKYDYQLQAKQNQIIQTLQRIGGFAEPPVAPVLRSPQELGYRNKATYPLRTAATGQIQAGYYQKGSHELVNLNQCPVQEPRLNPLLKEIKEDIQRRGWQIYNEKRGKGIVRHLSFRVGVRTGEILLTLIVNCSPESKRKQLPGMEMQLREWHHRYPQLVGVCLNYNQQTTNTIFGRETECIFGRAYLEEKFASLRWQLRADTFFQVNTEGAEELVETVVKKLNLQGSEIIVDAYCGVGTFSLPIAQQLRSISEKVPRPKSDRTPSKRSNNIQVIGLEAQGEAVELARINAKLNRLTNLKFYDGKVEELLPKLEAQPDIVLLDPPRKGCDAGVLETLVQIQPSYIVYISCKPATLARDLRFLCESGNYDLVEVQPADFFPQTSHVECAAFLRSRKDKLSKSASLQHQ